MIRDGEMIRIGAISTFSSFFILRPVLHHGDRLQVTNKQLFYGIRAVYQS
jgi:hypothetical protein